VLDELLRLGLRGGRGAPAFPTGRTVSFIPARRNRRQKVPSLQPAGTSPEAGHVQGPRVLILQKKSPPHCERGLGQWSWFIAG